MATITVQEWFNSNRTLAAFQCRSWPKERLISEISSRPDGGSTEYFAAENDGIKQGLRDTLAKNFGVDLQD